MALEPIRGRVAWVFIEENFDVDQIVGVKNIKVTDVAELSKLAMRSYDPDFASSVKQGDVVVGAANFGYGHPHYPPLRALRHLGVSAVIAESFSPGFWRGEISMGTPLVPCPGILGFVSRWDEVEVDWAGGVVRNCTTNAVQPFEALSVGDREMLETGGLLPYLKRALATGVPA